jgi:hypothetical protein
VLRATMPGVAPTTRRVTVGPVATAPARAAKRPRP